MWHLHVFSIPVLVLFGYSSFFPQSKEMHTGLIGDSNFAMHLRCMELNAIQIYG